MRLGYNTNGFSHHRLEDALHILADLGYESIALTLDHRALDPYGPGLQTELEQIRQILRDRNLAVVVETGARFLLDPRRKHQPTLLSAAPEERMQRLDFLCRAVDIGAYLCADAVSFWSGTADDAASSKECYQRLIEGCRELCEFADNRGVRLAFEPEPGMFIDTMESFGRLFGQLDYVNFGLTLDVGHLHCLGETPIAGYVREWKDRLWNVHIEDMRKGVHDHLFFGEGEIDLAAVMQSFQDIDYRGGVHVELSRHSHDAVETARRAMAILRHTLGDRC